MADKKKRPNKETVMPITRPLNERESEELERNKRILEQEAAKRRKEIGPADKATFEALIARAAIPRPSVKKTAK